ncbi:hypothetical protein D3C81_1595810 [compost metagenome]
MGSTSRRPRLGAPLGPAGTKRPLRASSRPRISAGPQASRRGATTSRRLSIMALTSAQPASCGSGLARESGGSIDINVEWSTDSRASPLPQGSFNTPEINCAAYSSRRSRVSPAVRQISSLISKRDSGRGPVHGSASAQSSGSNPNANALANARSRLDCAPRPSPRGMRNNASKVSIRKRPVGDSPNTCRPSRICDSFKSHR